MFKKRDSPADDDLFEILGNSRRRLALYHLIARDDEMPLWDLSREIAAHEIDAPSGELDDEKLTSVYVSLYQTHVPALEECGVVEYDKSEGVVSIGERINEVASLLRDTKERRREWAGPYLFVAGLLGSVVLVSLVRSVVVPEGIVTGITIGGTAALVVLAVSRYYDACIRQVDESSLETLVS